MKLESAQQSPAVAIGRGSSGRIPTASFSLNDSMLSSFG
jgi:hypothetical protein